MKILHSSFALSRSGGGVSEVVREIARPLKGVSELQHLAISPQEELLPEERAAWACPVQHYNVKGPASLGYSSEIADLYRQFQPDVCHMHGVWMYYSRANFVACRDKTPYVVSPHGMLDRWAVANSSWKKRIAGFLYEDAHLKNASALHALCEAEADEFRRFGLKAPITIIPNGVNLPSKTHVDPPWTGAFEEGRPVMLYLGRLHPKKGLLEFVDSWKQATCDAQHKNWALGICGWAQGSYGRLVAKKIRELGMDEDVKLLGPVFGEQKKAAFQQCSAFVLPSRSEGLPVAVLEAWAAGKPVLMTKQCNLQVGFDMEAAVRLESLPESCSSQLRNFLERSQMERRDMGQRGFELVSRQFCWPQIIGQYSKLYSSL